MKRCLFLSVATLCAATFANNLSYDLYEANFAANSFVAQGEGGDRYAVSTHRLAQSDGLSEYLAVSHVNVANKKDRALDDFFDTDEGRPKTWKEAEQSCAEFKAGDLNWRLPSSAELVELKKLGIEFVLSNAKHPLKLSNTYASFLFRGSQFRYLWTQEKEDQKDGIYQAFNLLTGVSVGHTAQKPLSFVCVTRVKVKDYQAGLIRPKENKNEKE